MSDSDYDSEELIVGNNQDDFNENKMEAIAKVDKKAAIFVEQMVHLHYHQRTMRKGLTIIQGLPEDLDLKKITKHFKLAFCTSGVVKSDDKLGMVIQLQGEHRKKVAKFCMENGIAGKENIKIHGF